MEEWIQALGGSALVVLLTSLSAPITANRWRLAQLDRLTAVLNRLADEDPSRPYFDAEVRRRGAWWAAAEFVRLRPSEWTFLAVSCWITLTAIFAAVSPGRTTGEPAVAMIAICSSTMMINAIALYRLRDERIEFYHVLIEKGPREFAGQLRKRKSENHFGARARKLLDFMRKGAIQGEDNVVTCPKGHPVGPRTAAVSLNPDFDFPRRVFTCQRCGTVLPKPELP